MGTAILAIAPVAIIILSLSAFSPTFGADPLCEGVNETELVTFPHEFNCSLYYECNNGEKTTVYCPNGLYFNNKTQSCDFPDQSGCRNREERCVGVTIDYLPDPNDCSNYIECYHGDSYVMSCPSGFWFSSSQKICVPPDQSDCAITTLPPWTTPPSVCWGIKPNQTVLISCDCGCSRYWRCDGSHLSLGACNPGLYFDVDRQMCDFPDIVSCDDTTKIPDPTTPTPNPTIIPTTPTESDPRCVDEDLSYWYDPTDCTKYIECYHGVSYEVSCPNGLYFDQSQARCVDPGQSDCGKTTPTPGTTTERSSDATDNPDCPYPESEGLLLPYPDDCTRYYECSGGVKVALDCPDYLWFNERDQICDYPYQADCKWGYL